MVAVLVRYAARDVGDENLDGVTHLRTTADGTREGASESLNHELFAVSPYFHIAAKCNEGSGRSLDALLVVPARPPPGRAREPVSDFFEQR